MKVESPSIERAALKALLRAGYGLPAARLTFIPKGEESYGYRAESAGDHYYVKVHDELRPADLDDRLQIAYALRHRCGLPFVLAPRPAADGRLLLPFGPYAVALFDYVDGRTPIEGGFDDDDRLRFAPLLAALHGAADCKWLPARPRERFAGRLEEWLHRVLAAAALDTTPTNPYQRPLRRLLREQQDDILATLGHLQALARAMQKEAAGWVLTHGDPTDGNLIRDPAGDLHLIDWADVALGPPERDLVYFSGDLFEPFLRAYLEALDRRPTLRPAHFAYYMYRWSLGEIGDYGVRLLLEELPAEENDHAWEEVRQYLPIQRQAVEQAADRMAAALQAV